MTVPFYVAFRFHGYAKEYAKWAMARTNGEAKRLKIRMQKPVPHITLFGPAQTNNLKQVITEVERVSQRYTLVPFKIYGLSYFDKPNKVIYLDIDPSPEIEQFQRELAEKLIWLCSEYTEWDAKLRHKFHSTIGISRTLDDSKFERLYTYAENHCRLENFRQHKASILVKLANVIRKYIFRVKEKEQGISQHLLRVTILGRGSRIRCEYDLVLKRWLNRRQALSRYWWRKTIDRFRELQSS